MDNDYTKRELELLFKRLEEKLDGIREDIVSTTNHLELRISNLEKKVADHDTLINKALAIWGIAVLIVGALINKFI
jgi:hypothetical protein